MKDLSINLALFNSLQKPICKICKKFGVYYTADILNHCSECNESLCSLHFENHFHLH